MRNNGGGSTVKRIQMLSISRAKTVLLSRSRIGNAGVYLFLLCFCAFMALPSVYAVIQAFKPLDEIFLYPPRFFVRNPTLDNFSQVLTLTESLWVPFSRYLFNSTFITLIGTTLYVFLSASTGYALGKGNFRGKRVWSLLIVWALCSGRRLQLSPPTLSYPVWEWIRLGVYCLRFPVPSSISRTAVCHCRHSR